MVESYSFLFPDSHRIIELEDSFADVAARLEEHEEVETYDVSPESSKYSSRQLAYTYKNNLGFLRKQGYQIHFEGGETAYEVFDELDFS